MAPIRNYSGWNRRASDSQEPIEPYQKFFFICEGANTEVFYFKKLIDLNHSQMEIALDHQFSSTPQWQTFVW